ncbi:protein kinase [Streptomyces sp. TRM76323]|uniref:Protein kinase n=1 Tax=Streptomyces tamarix TaxID=3078565 RepID=A0ABU3QFS8_9ACTN|nr:protein kinase [Streptomyces tamarix]MDT9681630.1 protein kinase [Streptomyces tamarix]
MHPLEAGEPRAIGPYRLLGRLGSGGMGRVYLARSEGGRTVAVKVVHPHFALDGEFRARFRREVESARRVGARWTAPVLDADPDAPVPWVATGYVAGPSLSQAVTAHGPLPERSVRVLGAGLGEALAAVHALGLVHRDVKPSNVLLALDGPRLIDFGIARATAASASLTSTGVSVGSPGYMSPEQIVGKAGGSGVTGASDVFSLGAVLAYAATGTAPFSGDSSAALLYKVVYEEPELDPSLTGPLRDLVTACLAKDPGARPAPADLAAALVPGGAAGAAGGATTGAAAGGWLPAAVVEEVSRAAVRLLDLEPAGADAGASGPVPFSSPAVAPGPGPLPHEAPRPAVPSGSGPGGRPPAAGPGSAGDRGTAANARGTADPWGTVDPRATAGPWVTEDPRATADPRATVDPWATAGPWDAAGPGAVDPRGVAHLPTADAVPPPRRPPLSVSATVASEPAGPRGGRRLSCTLALAVAGALAGVTVGAAVLFDLLPGGANDTAHRPPTSDSGTSAPAATAPAGAAVPKAFVGTWKGRVTADAGALGEIPAGTFTVALKGGRAGQEVGTVTQHDILGNLVCEDTLVLRTATADTLVTDGSASDASTGVCTGGTHTVTLRLKGGKLHYASDDARAGRPRATLDRAE